MTTADVGAMVRDDLLSALGVHPYSLPDYSLVQCLCGAPYWPFTTGRACRHVRATAIASAEQDDEQARLACLTLDDCRWLLATLRAGVL